MFFFFLRGIGSINILEALHLQGFLIWPVSWISEQKTIINHPLIAHRICQELVDSGIVLPVGQLIFSLCPNKRYSISIWVFGG